MECSNCGAVTETGQAFCGSCGTPVRQAPRLVVSLDDAEEPARSVGTPHRGEPDVGPMTDTTWSQAGVDDGSATSAADRQSVPSGAEASAPPASSPAREPVASRGASPVVATPPRVGDHEVPGEYGYEPGESLAKPVESDPPTAGLRVSPPPVWQQ